MAARFSFSDLWKKGNDAGITPVVVTVDNPNQSVVEVENENVEKIETLQGDKGRRGKNARQLTWVLLLKAHRAQGFLLWLAMWLWAMIGVVKNRVICRQGGVIMEPDSKTHRGKLFVFIKTFLAFSVAAIVLEIGAYIMGWHIYRHIEIEVIQHWIYLMWVSFRSNYIAPPLQALADVCSVFFLIQSADRLILSIGCLWIKYMRINPKPKNNEDVEQGEAFYPMVLIQIPMCNEREVYAESISAVCQLDWPKDRILIQVLDDSDEEIIQLLVKGEVQKWRQKGVDIVYRHRVPRTGYKAGNLNSAMNCDYVKDYEFVAIFDADFQPNPDFLKRTIPHFKDNPELGLVQARWAFVNKDENLLTRLQYINLSFHFEVEQQVNGVFINFFGFNGTAGVWRIKTLEESGGWLDRTMVEDMDIAVRAHLNGWKFIFLNDVQVLCELPESYEAYRKQQHRWHSGPMQLFRLCLPDIISSKISVGKKANIILLFFLLRKLVLPFYSFTLFCILLPMTMFVPEAHLPIWVICHLPALMSFLNVLPALKSFPLIVPYLLFENTMSVTKFNAMISGLLQLGSASEWVVTKKTGRSSQIDFLDLKDKGAKPVIQSHYQGSCESRIDGLTQMTEKKKINHLYGKELSLAFLLLAAAATSLLSAQGLHFYFLLFQGISFLVVGLDLIGE